MRTPTDVLYEIRKALPGISRVVTRLDGERISIRSVYQPTGDGGHEQVYVPFPMTPALSPIAELLRDHRRCLAVTPKGDGVFTISLPA